MQKYQRATHHTTLNSKRRSVVLGFPGVVECRAATLRDQVNHDHDRSEQGRTIQRAVYNTHTKLPLVYAGSLKPTPVLRTEALSLYTRLLYSTHHYTTVHYV